MDRTVDIIPNNFLTWRGSSKGRYEQQEWLQRAKHVSMFIWASDCCFKQTWKIVNLSFKTWSEIRGLDSVWICPQGLRLNLIFDLTGHKAWLALKNLKTATSHNQVINKMLLLSHCGGFQVNSGGFFYTVNLLLFLF